MRHATEPAALADRIRAALADEPTTREVSMFGGLSFMVNEKMVVAARGDDDLLVRIDPVRHSELTSRTGVTTAEMGTGRTMGPGWISVSHGALEADDQLAFWLGVALEYNATTRRGGR